MESKNKLKLLSFFSGAGGLDLGFEKAGYEVIWANEFDRTIWDTYRHNFPQTYLETRSIEKLSPKDLPDHCDGIIGGPPCQSWSVAGARRGADDHRGQLFFKYIKMIEAKKPKFFLAENVLGLLSERNSDALNRIIKLFDKAGYEVTTTVVNARNFGVPQDRVRVIFVGYRKDLNKKFEIRQSSKSEKFLKDVIWDLRSSAVAAVEPYVDSEALKFPNHEYATGGFSYVYMSRNRVRHWHEVSYTIQASRRHIPLHPSAPKMIKVGVDVMKFDEEKIHKYRRLTVRECARIQTFPDNHLFVYKKIKNGYKMVGNAVPVEMAKRIAKKILIDLK